MMILKLGITKTVHQLSILSRKVEYAGWFVLLNPRCINLYVKQNGTTCPRIITCFDMLVRVSCIGMQLNELICELYQYK
jgi:hypothetical protein